MKTLLISIVSSILLIGCAGIYVPRVPPATEVDCHFTRTGGAMEGSYTCEMEGTYHLQELGL